MTSILSAVVIYFVVLIMMRVAGKRTVAQITTFDLVLLLMVSEATQQAMIRSDSSLTNAICVVVTLVMVDIGMSLLQRKVRWLDKIIDDVPLVLVEGGKPLEKCLRRARVDIEDVIAKARISQGLLHLHEIRYAVLERNGTISIIPFDKGGSSSGEGERSQTGV